MAMELLRSTEARVDLRALQNNVERVYAATPAKVMAVLKADAYGHGAPAMMRYLWELGVRRFAVAALSEAAELRRRDKAAEILILGHTPDGLLPQVARIGVMQTVFSLGQAERLSALGAGVKIHLKLDTGMHRIGFAPDERSIEEIGAIVRLPGVEVQGIYSHLALGGRESDLAQFAVFADFCGELERRGLHIPLKHMCGGIGVARYPQMHLDMVRPGGVFYGFGELDGLRPIMSVRSRVVSLRTVPAGQGIGYDLRDAAGHDRLVATLPFGYSDGVPRYLSHGAGHVVIRGQKAPFVGRLCMDMCMADVTGIGGVREDDEVFVIGGHPDAMTFPSIAEACGTNRNSILSGIPRRVPRVYVRDGRVLEVRDL